MCGIAGIGTSTELQVPIDAIIKDMCDAIVHRGPDDHGICVDGNLAVGMRRLSIIDIAGGHQPISNKDQTLWIVFNGEIYNYKALRKDLINRGHVFKTNSDTEVILHLV